MLSENDKRYCENFPTLQDCAEAVTEAVNELKNNKSPGMDVYLLNFIRCFGKISVIFYIKLYPKFISKKN